LADQYASTRLLASASVLLAASARGSHTAMAAIAMRIAYTMPIVE
jgi:hypothetical protein